MIPSLRSTPQETTGLADIGAGAGAGTVCTTPAMRAHHEAATPPLSQQNRIGLSAGDRFMRNALQPPGAESAGSLLDLGTTRPTAGRLDGASSHRASFVTDGRHVYRVKFNHHGPVATFHEVLAARMNQLLFPGPLAAEVKFGSHTDTMAGAEGGAGYAGVAIASQLLPGFQDLGEFLIWPEHQHGLPEASRTCSALPHVLADQRAEYLDLLREHAQNRHDRAREEASIRRDHPQLRPYLDHPKTDYTRLPAESVARLEPLRRLDAAALAQRHRMLALLPPAFRDALQQALYETEAIGNWDYANHDLFNVSPVIQNAQLVGATVIDFGVCGPIGFSGKRKKDNAENIQRPARLDDPYLHLGQADGSLGHIPALPYPSGQLLDLARVIDASEVSHSADPLALIPRSGSYRALMADVMPQQRDFGKLPAPMIKTAWRLSQVSPQQIEHLVRSVWNACATSADPAVLDMLQQVRLDGDTTASISKLYQTRRARLVERAGADTLARWALRHPARAQEAPF